ncbi:MAG: hypothetical protein AABY54_07835 [Deltaproteobacteria bacterium]
MRKKITDSSAQIKARTQGIYPSIAMYGLEQMHIAVPRDHSVNPYAFGMSYGQIMKRIE